MLNRTIQSLWGYILIFLFAVAGNYDDAIIAQVDNIQKEVSSEFKMEKGISFQFLIFFLNPFKKHFFALGFNSIMKLFQSVA